MFLSAYTLAARRTAAAAIRTTLGRIEPKDVRVDRQEDAYDRLCLSAVHLSEQLMIFSGTLFAIRAVKFAVRPPRQREARGASASLRLRLLPRALKRGTDQVLELLR